MPTWFAATFWGAVGGAALLIGAGLGYGVKLPLRLIAAVMAFGAGVLISALAFDLMDESYHRGGVVAASVGFVGGAVLYTVLGLLLARHGAKHRKRSRQQPRENEQEGSGLAIALGALLDGIPESIAIGVSMIAGGNVSWVTVAAVFLSNIPEGMSSSAGMKSAGRSPAYVFGVWGGIAAISSLASLVGYAVFSHFSAAVIAATLAVAAGAILAMIADTMMPEAYAETRSAAGLITVLGFLAAFALARLGG